MVKPKALLNPAGTWGLITEAGPAGREGGENKRKRAAALPLGCWGAAKGKRLGRKTIKNGQGPFGRPRGGQAGAGQDRQRALDPRAARRPDG